MNLENSKEKRSEYLFSRYLDFGGDKGYLDKTETYQMFLMIHGLASASLKNQVVSKEEADEELNKSMTNNTTKRASNISNNVSGLGLSSMTQKKKKLDLSGKQFDYIYKNKIQNQLDEPGKFNFKDMNILFNAYEYWRYENINNKNFKQIDQLDRQIEENLRKSSVSNDGQELNLPQQ
jgi:hypothetical protein